ncbi:Allantoate permease [Cyphellophora attinorum]|uniref:Allantoate permease n=1 Tax=Cyphellophora attinorum TaxID=1664694 RepID=A0A0N1HM77_9EURO|nr:Allantoate permease [Phialophora attinorum]KPI38314.1 Allantoate permease [Phialophora attinorum]
MGKSELGGFAATDHSPSLEQTIPDNAPVLPQKYADESYKLFSKVQVNDPTPEEARIIRNKCLWRILPFLCIGYHLMYVDKQTLGSSAILGILQDAHLNANQYNWLSSIFYFGYGQSQFLEWLPATPAQVASIVVTVTIEA